MTLDRSIAATADSRTNGRPPSVAVITADHSLPMSTTSHVLPRGGAHAFDPFAWDEAKPPAATSAISALQPQDLPQFEISRDPEPFDE